MKANKKGVSLAFVIVVVLALVILSSMLFTAAARSMSMTGRSTEGRAAYLKAKSAIEYAKTEVYNLAKSNTLTAFSIGPSGDYFEPIVAQAPNGTSCLAECAPEADGKTWKITAKVKYSGFEQYRQMSYSFTLEQHKSTPVGLPASNFLGAGVSYGTQSVLNDAYTTVFFSRSLNPGKGTSGYPVIENGRVHSRYVWDNFIKAPEIFFLGSFDHYNTYGLPASIACDNSTGASIYSDYITIANNIFYSDNLPSKLQLFPMNYSGDIEETGIICFLGNSGGTCSIVNQNWPYQVKADIPAGYYRFDAGLDLCDLKVSADGVFQDASGRRLVKLTQTEQNEDSLKSFQQDLAFVKDCYANQEGRIVSGGPDGQLGANFESGGVFGSVGPLSEKTYDGHWNLSNTQNMEEKTVSVYATSTQWSLNRDPKYSDGYGAPAVWNPVVKPFYRLFTAKQLYLRFVNNTQNFVLPNQTLVNQTYQGYYVVFHSDLVALSMAKTDTDPGTDADHRPKIMQSSTSPDSKFLLTSLSKDASGKYKNVTLAVQNDIKVVYSAGSYVIPSGVYSVPSGFDFFEAKKDWAGFWSGCRKGDCPSSSQGGGSSGTPGSFTITPGQYSVS